MPDLPRVGDLEIKQDLDYQRREWVFQRVGWGVMAAVVVAALLGLLGRGPLSSTSLDTPDGALRMEYNRFLNYHHPTALVFRATAEAAQGHELRLWLSCDYLEGVQVERVTPEPERVEAGPDGHTYVFRLAEPGRPTAVTFHLVAEQRWLLSGRVGLAGREPASFWQFAYP